MIFSTLCRFKELEKNVMKKTTEQEDIDLFVV